jgi:hypothetical protein
MIVFVKESRVHTFVEKQEEATADHPPQTHHTYYYNPSSYLESAARIEESIAGRILSSSP